MYHRSIIIIIGVLRLYHCTDVAICELTTNLSVHAGKLVSLFERMFLLLTRHALRIIDSYTLDKLLQPSHT